MAAATATRAASPGGVLAGSLIFLVAGVCTAQREVVPGALEPPSSVADLGTGSTPPPAERRVPLDRVVATVNKKAILLSQLRPEFRARVAGIQNAERRMLSDDERQRIMRGILIEKVDRARRTEFAKTLGNHTPGQIEAWLEERRKAEQEERIRKYGSLNKLYQELNRFGTSAWALEEEERTRLLVQLAYHDMLQHIGDQRSLLVTPREMYRLWKKVRPKRKTLPGTLVAMVTLGPGTGPEAPELARKLAAQWAASDMEANEIAQKFGATALEDHRVTGAEDDPTAAWIKEFVATAKIGDVSAPIARRDGRLWILKAIHQDPGNPYRFKDPAVQRQLRLQIQNRKMLELQNRQLRRSKTQVRGWLTRSFHPWELR